MRYLVPYDEVLLIFSLGTVRSPIIGESTYLLLSSRFGIYRFSIRCVYSADKVLSNSSSIRTRVL